MESFSKQLEPAILPAIRYVRLYQQLQSEQVVFSGKRKPLGRITCHEHNLFANPQPGYMCDLCGGSDKRRFTCVMACDFDGSLAREGVPGGGSAAELGLTSARSLWQVLGQRRCSGCSGWVSAVTITPPKEDTCTTCAPAQHLAFYHHPIITDASHAYAGLSGTAPPNISRAAVRATCGFCAAIDRDWAHVFIALPSCRFLPGWRS